MNGRLLRVSDGTGIWVAETGEGPPLVLVPGLGGAGWLWRSQVEELGARHRLIMPDLRGSGRSDKPDEAYTVGRFAGDIWSVLDQLGVERFHLLGTSLGGYVAQAMAAALPHRVRRLVLVATTLGGVAQAGPSGDVLARTIRPRGRNRLERLAEAYRLGFTEEFRAAHPELLEELTRMRQEEPQPEFAYYRQLLAGYAFDGRRTAAAIAAPTLVCSGESDPVVIPENADRLQKAIRDATVALFPGRHLFLIECAAAFNRRVLDFLGEEGA